MGFAVFTGVTPASTSHAGPSVRAKEAFNPKTYGAKTYLLSRVTRAAPPYGSTWCVGVQQIPSLRIKALNGDRVLLISYSQLARNYENPRLLRSATKKKAADYQRLRKQYRSWSSRSSEQAKACRSASATPLRFGIADAVGVSQGSASSRRGSHPSTRQSSTGIKAVLADGSLRDAITSGTAQISKIAVAPSGLLVVAFSQKVNLDNATSNYSSTGCMIVTVDRSTGVPTCIDDSLQSLGGGSTYEPIQFDASGGIYYAGSTGSASVLRRHKNGVITDLINGQIFVGEFRVAGNGIVLIRGSTTATNAHFNRRVSPSGGIQNLGPPASVYGSAYRLFSDGNIYMYADGGYGLARFNVGADTLDSALWIGSSSASPTNAWDTYCSGAGAGTGPCPNGLNLSTNSALHAHTASGKDFIPAAGGIVQAYPTLAAYTTPLNATTIMAASGNTLLLAGTTTGGENLLVRFDTTTNTPTTISSRSSSNGEIEFYHLLPSSQGYALFDGLRFNDNTYVIGKIDYTSGAVTILSTVTGKLDDFRTF